MDRENTVSFLKRYSKEPPLLQWKCAVLDWAYAKLNSNLPSFIYWSHVYWINVLLKSEQSMIYCSMKCSFSEKLSRLISTAYRLVITHWSEHVKSWHCLSGRETRSPIDVWRGCDRVKRSRLFLGNIRLMQNQRCCVFSKVAHPYPALPWTDVSLRGPQPFWSVAPPTTRAWKWGGWWQTSCAASSCHLGCTLGLIVMLIQSVSPQALKLIQSAIRSVVQLI